MFDAGDAYRIDSATATSKGGRPYQEDAVLSDFAVGADVGFAVLADGMGGHAAGDIASKIVVTVMFSELSFRRGQMEDAHTSRPELLKNAANTANQCIADYVAAHPKAAGMGATLVAIVLEQNLLRWISVGDSPLYLYRNETLSQLNADHSLAAQIDLLRDRGVLSDQEAQSHPDRNVLTSALMGEDIALMDVPDEPVQLMDDDLLIMASDGIQALPDKAIEEILQEQGNTSSREIATTLMQSVTALNKPNLDNVSFAVLRVQQMAQQIAIAEGPDTSLTEIVDLPTPSTAE